MSPPHILTPAFQPLNKTPKNIFKETKEEATTNISQVLNSHSKDFIDVQFSDKYSKYKRNDEYTSEMFPDDESATTMNTEYTQDQFQRFKKRQNSLASLYDFRKPTESFQKKSKILRKILNKRFNKISNQYGSEKKKYFKKKKQFFYDVNQFSDSKNYSLQGRKMKLKRKLQSDNMIDTKNSIHLIQSKRFKKRSPIKSIYEKNRYKVASPSRKSPTESSDIIYSISGQGRSRENNRKIPTNQISTYETYDKRFIVGSKEFTSIQSNNSFSSKQMGQRPIININLGNQPVENLKIVSVPNERGVSKEAMTIQVSYTPSKGSIVNRKLNNILSLENSNAEKRSYRNSQEERGNRNIVKSILSKRRGKKEFSLHFGGNSKTYNPKSEYVHKNRVNNESLIGFNDLRHDENEFLFRNQRSNVSKERKSKHLFYYFYLKIF